MIISRPSLLTKKFGVNGEIFKITINKRVEFAGGKNFFNIVIRLKI